MGPGGLAAEFVSLGCAGLGKAVDVCLPLQGEDEETARENSLPDKLEGT